MFVGRLDREVVIQQYTTAVNNTGQPVASWSTLATVWARVTHTDDKESFPGNQKTPEENVTFRIRWRTDVTEKMRISYDSKFYDIQSIRELSRKDGLLLKTIRQYHS